MVLLRGLATRAKESHFGVGLKAVTFLLAFVGVVLSVLGSLTCRYLRYHDDGDGDFSTLSPTTMNNGSLASSSSAFPPLGEDVVEAWIGLFSYDVVVSTTTTNASEATTTTTTISSDACLLYDSSEMFGNAPSILLSLSQLSAVAAPSLAILCMLAFLTLAAGRCCCRCGYRTVGWTMLLTTAVQAGTLLPFLDPSLW